MVTSSELIARWLPTYNFRLEHEEGYERMLNFTEDGTPADGESALEFTVRFAGSKTTSFIYDEDDSLYYLNQHGNPYIDGNDGTQLSFTNVLILRTSISHIPGDREGRRDVRTTGTGTGYFVCGGQFIDIEWSRTDNSSQFVYTNIDGSELILGRGKTYICIVSLTDTVGLA
jgi:hypothetical protein